MQELERAQREETGPLRGFKFTIRTARSRNPWSRRWHSLGHRASHVIGRCWACSNKLTLGRCDTRPNLNSLKTLHPMKSQRRGNLKICGPFQHPAKSYVLLLDSASAVNTVKLGHARRSLVTKPKEKQELSFPQSVKTDESRPAPLTSSDPPTCGPAEGGGEHDGALLHEIFTLSKLPFLLLL